jgi:hypothetical protein
MAHYAFLDENNVVTEVIVGKEETEKIDGSTPEQWYSQYRGQVCLRTSYNRKIRGNFASIGMVYHSDKDVFMPEQCHPEAVIKNASWDCLNEEHVYVPVD